MRKSYLALVLLTAFSGISLFAQSSLSDRQANLDSLYAIWQDQSQPDSSRINSFHDFIYTKCVGHSPDSAIYFGNQLYAFSKERNSIDGMQKAHYLLGYGYTYKAQYASALKHLKESDRLAVKPHAATLALLGGIYGLVEDFPMTIEYFKRSLDLRKKNKDKAEIAGGLINLGIVYKQLTFMGDSAYLDSAYDLLSEGLKICRDIGKLDFEANAVVTLGELEIFRGNYDAALQHFKRCIEIYEEIENLVGASYAHVKLGIVYSRLGDDKMAMQKCLIGLEYAQKIGNVGGQKLACECLYATNRALGNILPALEYLELMTTLGDSMHLLTTGKGIQKMEFEKQLLADSLATAEHERLVEEGHQAEVRKKNKTRNMLAGGGLLLFVLAGALFGRVRYIRKAKEIIEKEKDRSENLLLNILPADIAEELKIHGKAEARDFDLATIIFTDFKGFTQAAAKLSAQDLVAEINSCFEAFDGIMTKYNIEKIKTIGDAYMAAGGLPVPADDSVKKTILAALEMQAFIVERHKSQVASGIPAFEMRVGIHTGPVVAGIVGVKKFQYDIWGDTVNTASRIESNGEVGKVNISQATYDLLKDDPDFSFESRGKIEAKGKGEIEMFFVSRTLTP